MLHGKIIEHRLQVFILPPQRLMRATGDFDIAVIPHHRQNFLRQYFVTERGIIRPVIAIGGLRRINIPLRRVIAFFHHFIHQLQGTGDNGPAGFLRVEELMFIHLFSLRVVADINHIHVLIGSAQEQIQQNIKALRHVLGGLIHRTGDVHQTEHHRLTGRFRTFLVILVTQVESVNKRHAIDFRP
ncbi:hypothetical protein D3C76_1115240 [compost metagenome]